MRIHVDKDFEPDFHFNGNLSMESLRNYFKEKCLHVYRVDPFVKYRGLKVIKLRQSLMYVLYHRTNLSGSEIGIICSNEKPFDHATIINAVKKAIWEVNDPDRQQFVNFWYNKLTNYFKKDTSLLGNTHLDYLNKVLNTLNHTTEEKKVNDQLKKLVIENI